LTHIRISPFQHFNVLEATGFSVRALECAEEFRVNTVLTHLGFSTILLCDGSENAAGERVSASGDWSETLCFLLAVVGTGGERGFLNGVRRSQPTWVTALRVVRKRALAIIEQHDLATISATKVDESGLGSGYRQVTLRVAAMLDRASASAVPLGTEAIRLFRKSLEDGARRAPSGRFAPLVFDTASRDQRVRPIREIRHHKLTVSGTTLRYPSRLVLDPQRRAFAARSRRSGGVVLIDQSGSMDIDAQELTALLFRAPDALVLGYSHRPGDNGLTPNVWCLVQGGVVRRDAPSGNVGNGVDGPALRYAIQRARRTDPIVWVTDGQVTDSNDHPCDELTLECALLVRKHRIRLVRRLSDAGPALGRHRPFVHSDFGRVGRKLLEIRDF
jgi:hypothetical protein